MRTLCVNKTLLETFLCDALGLSIIVENTYFFSLPFHLPVHIGLGVRHFIPLSPAPTVN